MILKNMAITNSRGDSITFGRHFRLMDDFLMSGLQANINYSDSTIDGSNYQNTILKNREFDIPFVIVKMMPDSWWIEEKRNELYKIFNPKANPFRIDITTKSDKEYYINANLDGSPSFPLGFENNNKSWQKGLLQFSANDPYIYNKNDVTKFIALWVPAFEFPLEITDGGIEMGYRENSFIENVFNEGQEETGMIIRFTALGTLINPSVTNIKTYETIKVNTEMLAKDMIEVSTYRGKRSVTLIRNGQKTNIFNLLDFSSTFFQLSPGDNLIKYDADTNVNNLEVAVNFTPRLLGV